MKNLVFFLILGLVHIASAVELWIWQRDPDGPKMLIARRAQETPEQAVQRFVQEFKSSELVELLKTDVLDSRVFQLSPLTANVPHAQSSSAPLSTLIIANWGVDFELGEGRMRRNLNLFAKAGAHPLMLPLGATLGLTPSERLAFHEQIVDKFAMLVALGGDDIDPRVYGEENLFAKKTNLTRDSLELELIKHYKQSQRGFFFGICRGHQLGAIADGHRLYQDLTRTGVAENREHFNVKGEGPTAMQRWHGLQIVDSILKDIFGVDSLWVNSVHHQAVRLNPRGLSQPVAFHGDVIEALQQHNGLGLSVQFHPEFPSDISLNPEFSEAGFLLIKQLIQRASQLRRGVGAPRCAGIFSSY